MKGTLVRYEKEEFKAKTSYMYLHDVSYRYRFWKFDVTFKSDDFSPTIAPPARLLFNQIIVLGPLDIGIVI